MGKAFTSKALAVNLSHTHAQITELPESQKWFRELSRSAWGIHNRAHEFLSELNHKYRNDRHVAKLLHDICLEDFWFYNSLPEAEQALNVLLDIFSSLLDTVEEREAREMLITTLIQFIGHLSGPKPSPAGVISRCFAILEADMDRHELLYIRNCGYFKTCFGRVAQNPAFFPAVHRVTTRILERCIDYWQQTSQAEAWFDTRRHLFTAMEAETLQAIGLPFFERLHSELELADTWEALRRLMFYNDIANYFRGFSENFTSSLESIYYFYYLLHLPGMSNLYDHLLYDINRKLRSVFKELGPQDIPGFLAAMVGEFDQLRISHPSTVLDCVATLGKEVISTGDHSSIAHFISSMVAFGFNYPGTPSLNSDWQVQINTSHVKNIRVYLELISQNPELMRELVHALIVELTLGGVYISDTDLFQRDVTKLLNADIAPAYREIKQLARMFPVFFREIGAEGKLREVTTAIDSLSLRKDRLIHFLRVQIHVESNNTNIALARRIIEYWYDGDKQPLKQMLPDDLYQSLDADKTWQPEAQAALRHLCETLDLSLSSLLELRAEKIKGRFAAVYPQPDLHQTKVLNMFQIHALLLEKYSFASEDVVSLLQQAHLFAPSDISQLQHELERGHPERAIAIIYGMMDLVKGVILDPAPSEAVENIQYKRHIAAGIPSTYGQYIEPKFEALGLMYRLELVISKLMRKVVHGFAPDYVTNRSLEHIYDVLLLFQRGLALDGISDPSFNAHLEMFKYCLVSPSFSLNQHINVFQFMAHDISQIIRNYFLDLFEHPLSVIIPQVLRQRPGAITEPDRESVQMETEKFLRDMLSSAFLLQELDLFVTNTIGALRNMLDIQPRPLLDNILTYDHRLTFSLLTESKERVDSPVFLGAKSFFLKQLTSYGFPVPPGFIITSEAFRHIEALYGYAPLERDFLAHVERYIEAMQRITGKKFGHAANPLFFSVRSGSFVSLPGAMLTFLNVGMNEEIAEDLSRRGLSWTAWDCYRRFLQSWGMAFGVERELFDQVLIRHKKERGLELKINFSGEEMRRIAYDYKQVALDHNILPAEDPLQQLRTAIRCVLGSWSSPGSVSFRDYMQIAGEWGTAVLVQKMVFGNLNAKSGSGVVFTGSPFDSGSEINLYGDFAVCSQGEDVVAGVVNTLPISEAQRQGQDKADVSLESAFPRIYGALREYARQLIEQRGFAHQEIEFTFESADPRDLYILQTRNQNIGGRKSGTRFAMLPQEMKLVGHGIGLGGGVLSGLMAMDMEDMRRIREQTPSAKIILVRSDTVPDDIPMLFVCDGLITAKGGMTSHAAMTAAGLGKACVVKCRGLLVNESQKHCLFNGHIFKPGDAIAIDGGLGHIYQGNYQIVKY